MSVYPGKMSCMVTTSSPLDEAVLFALMTVLIDPPKSRPSIESWC
ncbi:rCG28822 [Rattus norvegicus]|uniref:RCG28822 n=1 Tax=Rattus norvegicus TaxID=10116 RepID=A6HV54_RAT|nr:rCG28822 [Rattus norvegicus]